MNTQNGNGKLPRGRPRKIISALARAINYLSPEWHSKRRELVERGKVLSEKMEEVRWLALAVAEKEVVIPAQDARTRVMSNRQLGEISGLIGDRQELHLHSHHTAFPPVVARMLIEQMIKQLRNTHPQMSDGELASIAEKDLNDWGGPVIDLPPDPLPGESRE